MQCSDYYSSLAGKRCPFNNASMIKNGTFFNKRIVAMASSRRRHAQMKRSEQKRASELALTVLLLMKMEKYPLKEL